MLFYQMWIVLCAFNSIYGLYGMVVRDGDVQRDLCNIKILLLDLVLLPARISLRVVMHAHHMPKRKVL